MVEETDADTKISKKIEELKDSAIYLIAQKASLIAENEWLKTENERLKVEIERLKKSRRSEPAWLNEALNSGDGVYRP